MLNGKTFIDAEPREVIDYLKSNTYEYIEISKDSLSIIEDKGFLYLKINDKSVKYFPLREAFVHKLLKWHNLSENLYSLISLDLFVGVINELIRKIYSNPVIVKLENKEALTIFSKKFVEIKDLELYQLILNNKIHKIFRDDFITRFITKYNTELEPVVGDISSVSYEITNSENGFAATSINFYIYRYICSNGASVPFFNNEHKFYHYGADKTYILNYVSGLSLINDDIINVLSRTLKKSLKAQAIHFKDFVYSSIKDFLSKEQQNRLFMNFEWYKKNKYDLYNHITQEAKKYDLFTRFKLERLAGFLILHENYNSFNKLY